MSHRAPRPAESEPAGLGAALPSLLLKTRVGGGFVHIWPGADVIEPPDCYLPILADIEFEVRLAPSPVLICRHRQTGQCKHWPLIELGIDDAATTSNRERP